jgi:hypothetical protein
MTDATFSLMAGKPASSRGRSFAKAALVSDLSQALPVLALAADMR